MRVVRRPALALALIVACLAVALAPGAATAATVSCGHVQATPPRAAVVAFTVRARSVGCTTARSLVRSAVWKRVLTRRSLTLSRWRCVRDTRARRTGRLAITCRRGRLLITATWATVRRPARPVTPPPAGVAAPVARFAVTRASGPAPVVVEFDDASSGQITSRSWSFGADGADAGSTPDTSSETNPIFTYLGQGSYTASLTVRGPGGTATARRTIVAGAPSSPPQVGNVGEFVAYCPFSHRANNDPIVYPGQPGRSHSHDFYGNRNTDAFSIWFSLAFADTNCDPLVDKASYWAPTLYENGQAVPIIGEREATFYYLARNNRPGDIRAFPRGLKMIAGAMTSTSPQPTSVIKWACFNQNLPATSEMVYCGTGANTRLELYVEYPDCWDGRSRDSANHKSHMAYSAGGDCPTTHPVAVPALQFKSRYPSQGGRDPFRPKPGDQGPRDASGDGNRGGAHDRVADHGARRLPQRLGPGRARAPRRELPPADGQVRPRRQPAVGDLRMCQPAR